MAYFRDVVRNVYSVSGAIINRELVCSRYLIDWFACHAIGERVDLNYLLCESIREEMYMIVDDHIFFEKDRLEVLCSEIENPNYMYKVKAEEEARRKAEEEARRKAEEEARRKAEEEARRKAEEEARRKAAEEEARRTMTLSL